MLKTDYKKYILEFIEPGVTSRGVLLHKLSWLLWIWDDKAPEIKGVGEISIISGLSPELEDDVETALIQLKNDTDNIIKNYQQFFEQKPAVKFGIEIALRDLHRGGKSLLFPSDFTEGKNGVKINGLIWMGTIDEMQNRIKQKIENGFTCIKIKVGSQNFEHELDLLKQIRQKYNETDLQIRLDANGAFSPDEALKKIDQLSEYKIHSIEQPIKAGQWAQMSNICRNTNIPIALDEEFIGIYGQNRFNMLDAIMPQFIVLKPALLGGLCDTAQMVLSAAKRSIGWWVTSALESNVGLNAIAQWAYLNAYNIPQGLGTGNVFKNNFESQLYLKGDTICFDPSKKTGFY